jgi:hypothetical protein
MQSWLKNFFETTPALKDSSILHFLSKKRFLRAKATGTEKARTKNFKWDAKISETSEAFGKKIIGILFL